MADPFIGEIKIVGFTFPPRNWAQCDGQLLAISQNSALFSLFGTIYGGDGRTTFGLPDLRGRVPVHYGAGPGLTSRSIGLKTGAENTFLTVANLPAHSHPADLLAHVGEGNSSQPDARSLARTEEPARPYHNGAPTSAMAAGSVSVGNTGSNSGVSIMQPFLVLNFVVALTGLFPSRN